MQLTPGLVAVITGAGSGIGAALALDLARRGLRLALSDRDREAVQKIAVRCSELGVDARAYQVDVADAEAVQAHAGQVVADHGAVNLVVNNAGVALTGSVAEMTVEDVRWIMDINFYGVVHGTQAFLPQLIASGNGHLVNISSVFGLFSVPGQSAYNASKFAVRGWTEALRQEMRVAGEPVVVSCVHPGGIKTNIARTARAVGGADQEALARLFDTVARTTPTKAAATIVAGISKDKARILVGPDAKAFELMTRVLGARYQPLVEAAARRQLGRVSGLTARARTPARD